MFETTAMPAKMKTIFVSMAAFNEKHVRRTIESALDHAEFSERVRFGINYISSDGCFDDLSLFEKNINVSYGVMNQPRGWGIDRASADSLWSGEDYYLQIDAHMLFEPNWDSGLINALENIKMHGFKKPIISTYIPWWSLNESGEILRYSPGSVNCCRVCEYEIGNIEKNWIEPQRTFKQGLTVCGDNFAEHYTIAGHFIFTTSEWIEEVGHDPRCVFVGDETMIALRSWTRGYTIFSIGIPYLWHFNKQGIFENDDWRVMGGKNNTANPFVFDSPRYKKDKKRMREYLLGEKFDFGGAPDKESLDAYQAATGLNFALIYEEIDRLSNTP